MHLRKLTYDELHGDIDRLRYCRVQSSQITALPLRPMHACSVLSVQPFLQCGSSCNNQTNHVGSVFYVSLQHSSALQSTRVDQVHQIQALLHCKGGYTTHSIVNILVTDILHSIILNSQCCSAGLLPLRWRVKGHMCCSLCN